MIQATKSGKRQPNGKLRRPTVAERDKLAKLKEQAEMQTVLAQPHRRGNTDQRCASALGRACMALGLPQSYYDAGQNYAALRRRWRAAKGIPTDERLGIGSGAGPEDGTVEGWEREIEQIWRALHSTGPGVMTLTDRLACDEFDVLGEGLEKARLGLECLARHYHGEKRQ